MSKRYLLDTNVFMRDPRALFAFQEHDVYVSSGVLQELDKFKKGNEEQNINARLANRQLAGLMRELGQYSKEERRQKINEGIPLGEGLGRLYFLALEENVMFSYADPELLYQLKKDEQLKKESELILVSNDTSLRLQAFAQGYFAEEYRHDRDIKDLHELLDMPERITLEADDVIQLRQERSLSIPKGILQFNKPLFNNQYLYVEGDTLLLRYKEAHLEHTFVQLQDRRGVDSIFGIYPKNKEQSYLSDLCLNDEIRIGTVLGKAGTGKTILTLAAALQKTIRENKFDRIVIIRPVMEIGEKLGFLPGDIDEKIDPYKGPIKDAAEVIFSGMRKKIGGVEEAGLEYLIGQGKILFAPLNYMRGRNLIKTYIIVDEAQNLTPSQAKTLATRTGQDSKIIFQGDPYQIDALHLDETNNGLVTLTKKLLGEKIFSTVVLKSTERSDVAELVARVM